MKVCCVFSINRLFEANSNEYTQHTIINIKRKIFQNYSKYNNTVKILKIGTPEIITMIVLQLEQLDFTVQYCVQKIQTE